MDVHRFATVPRGILSRRVASQNVDIHLYVTHAHVPGGRRSRRRTSCTTSEPSAPCLPTPRRWAGWAKSSPGRGRRRTRWDRQIYSWCAVSRRGSWGFASRYNSDCEMVQTYVYVPLLCSRIDTPFARVKRAEAYTGGPRGVPQTGACEVGVDGSMLFLHFTLPLLEQFFAKVARTCLPATTSEPCLVLVTHACPACARFASPRK